MKDRGLLGGIPDASKIIARVGNSEEEFAILRRFPFHEAATVQAALLLHSQAVRLLFQTVAEDKWLAVLGRFDRKLVKRMQHFKNQGK